MLSCELFKFHDRCVGRQAQARGGLLRDGVHEHSIVGFGSDFSHRAQNCQAAAVARDVIETAEPIQVVIEKSFRALDQLLKRLAAAALMKLSGSCGAGTTATRTARPEASRLSSDRTAAFWPASSESKQSTTSST